MSLLLIILFYLFHHPSCDIEVGLEDKLSEILNIYDIKKPNPLPESQSVLDSVVLIIRNQDEFDSIQDNLIELLRDNNKRVIVKINSGVYYYRHRHIALDELSNKSMCLSIEGDSATIVSKGSHYRRGQKTSSVFSTAYPFIDDRFHFISIWSKMEQVKGKVEVINTDSKLCRVYSSSVQDLDFIPQNAYIRLTEWYKSAVYPIERVSNGYIYFTATDLKDVKKDYNINSDYTVSGIPPRFQVCNLTKKNSPIVLNDNGVFFSDAYSSIFECRQGTFISINKSSFDEIRISGIAIVGNRSNFSLIDIRDSQFQHGLFIDGNSFEAMRGGVISIKSSDSVFVLNNSFRYIWGSSIAADEDSNNVQIIHNYFENTGYGLMNVPTITCRNKNYYIAYNEIKDFGSLGIGIGGWYGSGQGMDSFGIVEYNELWYSSAYRDSIIDHGLIDSGAIYCWTNNAEAIIRYNYIHNYCGISSNRGIYCDDGARNIVLYANIVMNIGSGATIHSRYVSDYNEQIKNNVNNICVYNILNGQCVFEGNPTENNCIFGKNYFINGEMYSKYSRISSIDMFFPNYDITVPERGDSKAEMKEIVSLIDSHPYFDNLVKCLNRY